MGKSSREDTMMPKTKEERKRRLKKHEGRRDRAEKIRGEWENPVGQKYTPKSLLVFESSLFGKLMFIA